MGKYQRANLLLSPNRSQTSTVIVRNTLSCTQSFQVPRLIYKHMFSVNFNYKVLMSTQTDMNHILTIIHICLFDYVYILIY